MIKKIIKKFFALFNLNISKNVEVKKEHPQKGYDYFAESSVAATIAREYSMMPEVNLLTLYEQAVYCEKNNIPGDFVECGVWKGGAVSMMAMANLKYGSTRRNLHLFDAFDDICEPDPELDGNRAVEDVERLTGGDRKKVAGKLEPVKGFYDSFGGFGTIEVCQDLLLNKVGYDNDCIYFYEGWFQDTVPKHAKEIDQIAILRLDGDWYESTKIPLDHLYDKVVKGGLIVLDDYGYYDGCTKAVDEFLKNGNIKTFLSYSNFGCRYFVKP